MRNSIRTAIKKGATYYKKTDNISGYTPLHLAVEIRDMKACEELVKKASLVNVCDFNGYTPLHLAVFNEYYEVVELLLKNGAKANATSILTYETPMHFAATNGEMWIIDILLKYKASLYSLNKNQQTPLEYLLKAKHEDIFCNLIDKCKLDLNSHDLKIYLNCLDIARKHNLKKAIYKIEKFIGININGSN